MPGQITLSRRNLLSLLHKLEMPGSACTIIKPTPTGSVIVSAVTDEVAYRNRAPGAMHPETEQFIADMNDALSIVRQRREAKRTGCNCGACHRT